MLIWVIAILLFGLFGALGYAKGAVRMIFPLIGLFVGAMLALPLGPTVQPLVPMVGLENPIWSILLPPVVVFFIVAILFIALGFVVHWKLNLFFKYRTDEYNMLRWIRLNQRAGACMGLVAGAVYTLLIGVVVYVLGYTTVQTSVGDNDPTAIRYLNKAREDLRASGLETTVAVLDPAPNRYYEAVDVLGLLHSNPLLDTRLSAYPPFLTLPDRPEFQEIANDVEYQNLLKGQSSLADIIAHPRTQEIIANDPLLEELGQIDLKDLYVYLKTGESEVYADQPILGRWEVDFYATLRQEKKRRSRMTSSEMRRLRQEMELIKTMKLVIAPDGSVRLKGPDVAALVRRVAEAPIRSVRRLPAPTVTAVPQTTVSSPQVQVQPQNDRMMQRYGRSSAQRPTAAQPTTVNPVTVRSANDEPQPISIETIQEEMARLDDKTLSQGNWTEDAGRYRLKVDSRMDLFFFKGSDPAVALIREGQLHLTRNNQTVVMDKF